MAVVGTADVAQQAEFVAQRVLELRDEGVPLPEIAVLYRAHHQALELQLELTRRGIPYEVRSGVRFFEQQHVKDVLAHLRLLVNPKDETSFKRALKLLPKVGERTAATLWAAVSESPDPMAEFLRLDLGRAPAGARTGLARFVGTMKTLRKPSYLSAPAEAIRHVVEEGGYSELSRSRFTNWQARLDDLEALAQFAMPYEGVESFLSEVTLFGEPGGRRDDRRRERRRAARPLVGPSGEGARVARGLRHRPRRGALPERPRVEDGRGARGGAAPFLCRGDAREGRASPRPPAGVLRQVRPPRRHGAVALPPRAAGRPLRAVGAGGRPAGSRRPARAARPGRFRRSDRNAGRRRIRELTMSGLGTTLPSVGLIVLRTAIVYVFVLAGFRLLGKRTTGQMTPFDLTLLLLLANSVQNAMVGPDSVARRRPRRGGGSAARERHGWPACAERTDPRKDAPGPVAASHQQGSRGRSEPCGRRDLARRADAGSPRARGCHPGGRPARRSRGGRDDLGPAERRRVGRDAQAPPPFPVPEDELTNYLPPTTFTTAVAPGIFSPSIGSYRPPRQPARNFSARALKSIRFSGRAKPCPSSG